MIPHNLDEVNPDAQLSPAHKFPQGSETVSKTALSLSPDLAMFSSDGRNVPNRDGKEVSKNDPCEFCGHTQWCFRSGDRNLLICGRTDNAPPGWRRIGTANDDRPLFVRKESPLYAQQRWSATSNSTRNYKSKQYVSPLPDVPPKLVRLITQANRDFPVWADLGQPVDGAVERQIIFSYPDPSTGKPFGRVIRCQWSDRRPAYNNKRTKFIRPEHWIDSSNPKEGKWLTGKGEQPWPLYREAEVREAITHGESVIFYGAGEQAVESFRELGLVAFCNQGGEGVGIKQIESFLKTHQPILFVIWADHDDQGEKTKIKLLKASEAAGVPAVAIDPLQIWADMPPKGDITNVLEDSGMKVPQIIHRLETEIHRALSQREEPAVLEQERQKLPATSAIALELAEQYRQRLAFDIRTAQFLHYESELPGVWSGLSDKEVQAMIQDELDFRPQTRSKYGISYVKSILELLKGYIQVKNWDEFPDLLPFRNGVLNLKTYEFLLHAPNHRLTWVLPRHYDPNATNWNRISEWMDEATQGDATIRSILCCWLNACIKGRSDIQRFLHLKGNGGAGKGTFMRLCVALVGSMNSYTSTLVDWCENRFEASNAYGKRLVVFWDQDKYRGGLSRFKSLTGGDLLRGEFKNKQPFQFSYTGMVVVSSNSPVFTGDSSSGMARRALIVPFKRHVALSQWRNLDAEFEPELAALTNYVLSIPDEVVTQTLLQIGQPSSEVLRQTWENRIQENSIASWLNEHLILDLNAKTPIGSNKNKPETLFGSYWQYCDRIGLPPLPGSQFTPALLDLCQYVLSLQVHKGRNNQFHYLAGLRLRTPNDAHIPFWQERIASHRDVQGKGDGDVIGEGDGANPVYSLDCVECDQETSHSQQDVNLDPNSDRASSLNNSSANSTSPITLGTSIQGEDPGSAGSSQVMEMQPNTLPPPEMKVADIDSPVCKRYEQGWRGIVLDMQGEWAKVLWDLVEHPEWISLAELEQIE